MQMHVLARDEAEAARVLNAVSASVLTLALFGQHQRSEAEFLKNAGGSALYESFVRKLGHYMPLADCA